MLDDDAAVSHPADTVLVSLLTHRSLKRGDFSHSGFVSSSAARATGPGAGRVKVVVRSADGGELTLTVIAPGGVFGELSAADGGPRSADAEILEDCRLLFVPHEVIQDLCGGRRRSPKPWRVLLRPACGGLPKKRPTSYSWTCRTVSRRCCLASPGTMMA